MTSTEIPRDADGRVLRPKPSQLLADVMDKLGPDHLTTRTLMAALIERDQGAGVEPRAVTPGYGWHIPVLSDPPNVPYDMQESSLDVEETLKKVGAFAVYTVNFSGLVAGVNLLSLTTLQESSAPNLFTLSAGKVIPTMTGVYLCIYAVETAAAANTEIMLAPERQMFADVAGVRTAAVNGLARLGAYATIVQTVAAGTPFGRPMVAPSPNAGASGTARFTAVYQGNPR
jgi:hypothetical protein